MSELYEILFSFVCAVTIIQDEWLFSYVGFNLSADCVEEVIELELVGGLSKSEHSFIQTVTDCSIHSDAPIFVVFDMLQRLIIAAGP